jgi:hypothetical protein
MAKTATHAREAQAKSTGMACNRQGKKRRPTRPISQVQMWIAPFND